MAKEKRIEIPRVKKKIKKYITKRRTLNSWLNYSGYAKDDFYISYSYFFFQSTHDCYFLSRIRLVLFPMLYKFIVWACWAKTQSYLGFKSKLVLTIGAHRGAWNAREMGVYPRIRCAALNWPSASLTYTSNCRILSRFALLTKRNKGVVELVSAKPLKPREMHFSGNKEQEETEE